MRGFVEVEVGWSWLVVSLFWWVGWVFFAEGVAVVVAVVSWREGARGRGREVGGYWRVMILGQKMPNAFRSHD